GAEESGRTRTVRVRVHAGALGLACSCTAESLDPPSCKHVWATLLELDRRGALGALRESVKPLAVTTLPADPREARAVTDGNATAAPIVGEAEAKPNVASKRISKKVLQEGWNGKKKDKNDEPKPAATSAGRETTKASTLAAVGSPKAKPSNRGAA